MKKLSEKTLLLTVAFVLFATPYIASAREIINFDRDWLFALGEDSLSNQWAEVMLPHDWNVDMDFDFNARQGGSPAYIPESMGWYKKTFELPEGWNDKNIKIHFDGIFHQSTTYVNDKKIAFHPYGFTPQEYDITPYLRKGKNVLLVKVDCRGQRPRWYAGAGIYRHVWLMADEKCHIITDGVCIDASKGDGNVKITTEINNHNGKARVAHRVFDADGTVVAEGIGESCEIFIPSVKLWDIDNPYLYTLESIFDDGAGNKDIRRNKFGVRNIEWDADKGFILNGRQLKLKGLCLHDDAGVLGTATTKTTYVRKLSKLKDYGANAIRAAHNPFSPEFYDVCDSLGLLVIDEAFDKWKSGYYEQYYDDWWQNDLMAMLRRDRNHPCVILWSIGNELSEAWQGSRQSYDRAKMMSDFVHKYEPSRPTNLAAQNNHDTIFAGQVDVTGYNYLEARAVNEHAKFPGRRMLITEELPYYSGEEGNIRAYSTYNPWNIVSANDFIAGGFIWAGVDYLGEAAWPGKGWPNCLFDIALHEKPRAAFHRAMWNDCPVVSIGVLDSSLDIDHGRDLWQWPLMHNHWNYPWNKEGLIMQLVTYTNCEKVKLYQDDKLMGEQFTKDHQNHGIIWNIPYKPGKVVAHGYNGDALVAEYTIQTTGQVHKTMAVAERDSIKADGYDIAYVNLSLLDDEDRLVQTDDRRVTVTVDGVALKLMGVETADLRRDERLSSNTVRTTNGRAQAVLRSTGLPGRSYIRFHVDGLEDVIAVVDAISDAE